MPPVVIFSTASDIEASVVMALLDSHGIDSFRSTGNTQTILPMAVNMLGEIRIAVAEGDAEAAARIIEQHREDVGSRVIRLRDEFEDLQARIDYRFRDRGLLEHALTHKSRAAEDISGGVADNESLEFLGDAVLGLVVADALFHQYPTYDEGQKSKIKASIVSTQALARAGLSCVELDAKEGLALINGTQASAAVASLALLGADRLARAADIAAALSIDGLRGSFHPFEPRIHDPRPYDGQRASAANLLLLLQNSAINKSHENCGRVQDAYSMRCAPQVHGAARDALAYVRRTLAIEANAATDNPMVFAGDGDIVSGGNFHGAPVSLAADVVVLALAQLATIAERRADRLVNPVLSGLPPFLTRDSGLHSGYMLAQVTAAALVSELKTLAHPASVDTIPTSANREDHVSMSMAAALKAQRALELASRVVAIEVLLACQAIDLLQPLTTSPALARVHAHVRSGVPTLADDRPPAPDIEWIANVIIDGALERACGADVK